jgi:hypothetical protein
LPTTTTSDLPTSTYGPPETCPDNATVCDLGGGDSVTFPNGVTCYCNLSSSSTTPTP